MIIPADSPLYKTLLSAYIQKTQAIQRTPLAKFSSQRELIPLYDEYVEIKSEAASAQNFIETPANRDSFESI